eukprot:GHVQ01020572.1.p1 GENE.GHVQ01020572.1~~GHVQ01020572.1.p1  ORF type:complete len:382 (-),score=56.44 GHVQ01020572.1:165-1310(-)
MAYSHSSTHHHPVSMSSPTLYLTTQTIFLFALFILLQTCVSPHQAAPVAAVVQAPLPLSVSLPTPATINTRSHPGAHRRRKIDSSEGSSDSSVGISIQEDSTVLDEYRDDSSGEGMTYVDDELAFTITTSNGAPVDDNQNSVTAGEDGPIVIGDFHLIDKLAHFDRERIPERVVHAKGAGAFGYFEVTDDITRYSKAKLFSYIGKRTQVLVRFSTVAGEKGSADTARDPRGFAVKFYTEDGNWDLVGNNTPVFFVRDPIKFPDFIHSQKKDPHTNLPNPNAFWDFLSLVPESIHQLTILFSDRGTPDGFRHMNGFSSHALKLVNIDGAVHYVKFHWVTDQGVKNLTAQEAADIAGKDADYATRDLFNAIETVSTDDRNSTA